MADELHYVILRGGTYDGRLALAPPRPGGLRLALEKDGARWSELYLYDMQGATEVHPDHGDVPVLHYMSRDEEE